MQQYSGIITMECSLLLINLHQKHSTINIYIINIKYLQNTKIFSMSLICRLPIIMKMDTKSTINVVEDDCKGSVGDQEGKIQLSVLNL